MWDLNGKVLINFTSIMIVKNLGISRLKLESRHVGRDDNNKWRHTQFFLGFGEVVPTNIPEDELLKESSLIKPTEL